MERQRVLTALRTITSLFEGAHIVTARAGKGKDDFYVIGRFPGFCDIHLNSRPDQDLLRMDFTQIEVKCPLRDDPPKGFYVVWFDKVECWDAVATPHQLFQLIGTQPNPLRALCHTLPELMLDLL